MMTQEISNIVLWHVLFGYVLGRARDSMAISGGAEGRANLFVSMTNHMYQMLINWYR